MVWKDRKGGKEGKEGKGKGRKKEDGKRWEDDGCGPSSFSS